MSALIKRHILCFLRDRWSVFFSFLSVLIILMLFAFFLGAMHETTVPEALRGTDEGNHLVYSWLFSGVLMVSTVTVPLGFLHFMVKDRATQSINDFYVTPLSRTKIVFSYLVAAILVSTALGVVNLLLGQVIVYLNASTFLPLASFLQVLGLIVLSSTLFSSLFYFVVSYLKSLNAHGTLSTLVGTLIGFVTGVYVPVANLGNTLTNILAAFPPLQMAGLFRRVYMDKALHDVFAGAPDAMTRYMENFGVDVVFAGRTFSTFELLVFSAFWIVLFVLLSVLRLRRFKV